LDDLIKALLAQYNFTNPVITPLANSSHPAYRIDDDGKSYVMRFDVDGNQPIGNLGHEGLVLAISEEWNDGEMPRVVYDRKGNYAAGDNGAFCLITTWLEGRTLTLAELTISDIGKIGTFLAQWHQKHSYVRRRQYSDFEDVFGDYSSYSTQQLFGRISPSQQSVVEHALTLIEPKMKGHAKIISLHGDFLLQNILIDGDTVRMVDLEYSRVGYPLYDLAPLLWQVRVREDWSELQAAYVDAYSQVRKLSKADLNRIESYVVARHIASLHWIAHNPNNPHVYPLAEAILAHRVAELEGFLKTGVLLRTTFVA
jgi:Ser/Thr protein kinase RdoA (MazF antagonist)